MEYKDISVPTTPFAGKYRGPDIKRVLALLPTDECVIWPGGLDKRGYGRTKYNGHGTVAHRAVWTEVNGRIPDGLVLDHYVCHDPSCVNPAHMDPTTQKVNVVERGWDVVDGSPTRNAKKTHCIRGHEFTPENTMIYVRSPVETQRVCRECSRAKCKAQYAKRKKRKQEGSGE